MRVGRTAVASPRDGIPEDLRLSEVLAGLTSDTIEWLDATRTIRPPAPSIA